MANQEKTTAAGSMTVSGMPELAELKGDVLLPVVSGKNYKAKLSALKTFINQGMVTQVEGKGLSTNDYSTEDKQKLTALPTNAQLTESLNNKLEKSVWDERNRQFGKAGRYEKSSGLYNNNAPAWRCSPFIPLNKECSIETNADFSSWSGVCFYDAAKAFLTCIASQNIEPSEFPENAVYFTVSTVYPTGKHYSNGDTNESRENAVAEAVSKCVEFCNKDKEQFKYSGFYQKDTGLKSSTAAGYSNSGFIPLSLMDDLEYSVSAATGAAAICFYSANRTFIKSIQTPNSGTISKEDFPVGAAYFTVSTITSQIGNSYYKNGETFEARENAVSDAIEKSKLALFVDMWERMSTLDLAYNYYPGTNTFGVKIIAGTTSAIAIEAKKYILTDMTYEQALLAYTNRMQPIVTYDCLKGRMNIVPRGYQTGSGPNIAVLDKDIAVYNDIEVIMLAAPILQVKVSEPIAINNSNKVKAITGILFNSASNPISFSYLSTAIPALEFMTPKIRANFDIRWFSKLSLFTMNYIVTNALNTSAITITVHPDVYAKLFNDEVAEYVPANLLLGSDEEVTTSSYAAKDYYFGDIKPKAGDKVTVTIWGNINSDKKWLVNNSGPNVSGIPIGSVVKVANGVYRGVGEWATKNEVGSASNTFVRIFNYPSRGDECTINKIKFEFGENTNPVWSPAIEEIEDAELREKAEWAALVAQAEAKQIQFVTTE